MDDPTKNLISRQAALDALEWKWAGKAAIDAIKNLPSAQPEIIRCKDCKFYTHTNRSLKVGICSLLPAHFGDDGYCSEAERREDD